MNKDRYKSRLPHKAVGYVDDNEMIFVHDCRTHTKYLFNTLTEANDKLMLSKGAIARSINEGRIINGYVCLTFNQLIDNAQDIDRIEETRAMYDQSQVDWHNEKTLPRMNGNK